MSKEESNKELSSPLNDVFEAIREIYRLFPDLNKWALGWALGLPRSYIVKIINGCTPDPRRGQRLGTREAVEIARLQAERDALRYCIRQFTTPGIYHDDSFEG